MQAETLVGLWELAGAWDGRRAAAVPPPAGTASSLVREFLYFDADATFFFARCPRDSARAFIDLRQHAAQAWLHRFFREGDGAVLVKDARTPVPDFLGMLPALVYPEFGGSGFTKGLGSWMRSVGVAGLVYPSARSDAAAVYDGALGLHGWHGWNFVDYRDAEFLPDRLAHFDNNDWYGFVGCRQPAPVLKVAGTSWALSGTERRYREVRGWMLELLRSPKTERL